MAKAALGRKLDNLMSEAKTAPPSSESSGPANGSSPGLAGLVRGAVKTDESATLGSRSSAPRRWLGRKRLLQASLVLGDLLLLGLAVRLVLTAHRPLDLLSIVLCSAAVLAGAWLTCLAFWLD